MISTIMNSHVYGLGSIPGERNVADTRNYSRHYRQRLGAEVLLNAVCDVTGVPERFSAAPAGTRADGLWTVRTGSLFLDTFGRPDPNQDPPCERLPEGSVVQALHLMNAPGLHAKATNDDGLPAMLAYVDKGLAPVLLAQPTYLWGYESVKVIVDKVHLKKDVPEIIPMELVRVTKDNLGTWARQLRTWGFTDVADAYADLPQ